MFVQKLKQMYSSDIISLDILFQLCQTLSSVQIVSRNSNLTQNSKSLNACDPHNYSFYTDLYVSFRRGTRRNWLESVKTSCYFRRFAMFQMDFLPDQIDFAKLATALRQDYIKSVCHINFSDFDRGISELFGRPNGTFDRVTKTCISVPLDDKGNIENDKRSNISPLGERKIF